MPQDVEFATKPALARRMIGEALDAGVPAAWVAGDEVYGNDPKLRADLAARRIGYVLAVARDHRITTGIGVRKAVELAVRLPASAWQRLSAGPGAKGERWYDWALIDTTDPAATATQQPQQEPRPEHEPGCHWLLIRRHPRTGELAFYRAYCPQPVRLAALVKVAGTRWRIEESFQSSKELAALDQHQVRRWTSWQRWTILAMLAHAFLSVMAAAQPDTDSEDAHTPSIAAIPLTRNEIRRLIAAATLPIRTAAHVLHWSLWRRRHQARARHCHYARQTAALT